MENIWYIKDAACLRCYMIAISMSINIYQLQVENGLWNMVLFSTPFSDILLWFWSI